MSFINLSKTSANKLTIIESKKPSVNKANDQKKSIMKRIFGNKKDQFQNKRLDLKNEYSQVTQSVSYDDENPYLEEVNTLLKRFK